MNQILANLFIQTHGPAKEHTATDRYSVVSGLAGDSQNCKLIDQVIRIQDPI